MPILRQCAIPKRARPLRASRYSGIPVINAGDGGHQHPDPDTDGSVDDSPPQRAFGSPDHRPVRRLEIWPHGALPLIKSLARYEDIRFILISPEELRVPDYIINDVLVAKKHSLYGGSAAWKTPCRSWTFCI